jgi:hypothetical protein
MDHAAGDESSDEEGEPFFRIDGVRCKAEQGSKVRIGMQLPSKLRKVVKLRNGEDRAAAVRRFNQFSGVQALVRAATEAGEPSRSSNALSVHNHSSSLFDVQNHMLFR